MGEEHGSDHSTAGLSAERIGRNDSIFRAANERINQVAEAEQINEATPFICECADLTCHEVVFMTTTDYAEIRQDARLFFNVPGHQASAQGWARVVETRDTYVVVEKIGPAAEVAELLEGTDDPETAALDLDERRRRDDPV